MAKNRVISWADAPAEHDYPAAVSYLELVMAPGEAAKAGALLSRAATTHRDAKDILRAARLPLLPPEDPAVRRDLKKVRKGVQLSPVLLVRGDLARGRALQIADGYHRVCASYHLDESTPVACRIVAIPPAR
jgi:hypothetical protein